MSVLVDGLEKEYDGKKVVEDFTTTFESGSISIILGASGCGKTTVLRCIAGLTMPDAGRVTIEGRDVFWGQRSINIAPEKRDVAMVFQSYAIWPHMTVLENVCLPLKAHGVGKEEAIRMASDALALVGLEGFASRGATKLSGGQQQRVALARSIVRPCNVLLLDEPLSNLDAKLRISMRQELKDLHQKLKATMIFVTHDQEEAMSLGDEIFLMHNGRLIVRGSPNDLYQRPPNRFVAEFFGKANFLPVTIISTADRFMTVQLSSGPTITIPRRIEGYSANQSAVCVIRPEAWRIDQSNNVGLSGCVKNMLLLGDRKELLVETALGEQRVIVFSHENVQTGSNVNLCIEPECIYLIPSGN